MGNNKKYAIICAYNGSNYHGCQLNNQVKTIESVLLGVLEELKFLPIQKEIIKEESEKELLNDEEIEEESEEKENESKEKQEESIFKRYDVGRIGLQRASRTDKGVHASFNTFVVKSFINLIAKKSEIQDLLPNDIYIYKILRVTKGFLAQRRCESRVYHYYIKKEVFNYKTKKREVKNILEKIICNSLGYKDYFNFTSTKNKKDTKRFIRRIQLKEDGDYFLVELEGNSFLYNQIRKMMGYLVQVIRNGLTNLSEESDDQSLIDYINESFNRCFAEPMDILKAPGEFLILYGQGYKNYNERHSELHGKIEVNEDELESVTNKLIKEKMLVKENDEIFLKIIDKFEEPKENFN